MRLYPNSPRSRIRWRNRIGVVLAISLSIAAAFWLRSQLVSRALAHGLRAVQILAAGLPEEIEKPFEPVQRPAGGEEGNASGSEQGVEESIALPGTLSKKLVARAKRPPSKADYRVVAAGPAPKNTRATAERVLGWASRRLMPQGTYRPEEAGLPAGIDLRGVSVLGIGLRDGDRLLAVDGVSVLDKGQVVGAVLSARAQGAKFMNAQLVRRTEDGPKTFVVVVEQPYLPSSTSTHESLANPEQ